MKVKVKVWSAMPVNAADIEKIRYIMKNSTNRNRDMANAFPSRFKRRKGNEIFFDAGKRRYCQEVK